MNAFIDFNLAPFITEKLAKQSISQPTAIQQQSIPVVLKGKDILGSAETGSGKTLAFAVPIIHKLYDNPKGKAIIIAPTRELAEQIDTNMRRLIPQKISTALLIGGAPIFKQVQQLRRNPQIIIGTPGRMIDHLERGKLNVTDTSILVLDETDRMLDMGFTEQINEIVKETPDDRQTLLFSATMPKAIIRTAKAYLKDPVRIQIGETTKPSENITQKFVNVENKEKLHTLVKEAKAREGSIIVFVKTKLGADTLCQKLQKQDLKADTIHGDLRHGKRQRVIRAFHQKRFRILVATDVAARGLDIPHIEHVVNYDLPQSPEDYVHRVGRTARGGKTGESLSLVSSSDQFKLRAIKRFIAGDDDTGPAPGKRRPRHKDSFSKKTFSKGKPRKSGERSDNGKRSFSDKNARSSGKFSDSKPNYKGGSFKAQKQSTSSRKKKIVRKVAETA